MSVWLDRHDAIAGPLEKQVGRVIRLQDVVLLVLSKSALESEWVWLEINWALEREKKENRDVLCPVSVDDAWKTFKREPLLMRQVKNKNILDFSKWKTKVFETQFKKLLSGLKIFYGS